MKKYHQLVSTWFKLGYFPVAPGTLGSVAGLLLFAFIDFFHVTDLVHGIFLLCLTIIGTISANQYSKQTLVNDPKQVIIDEVVGQYLALLLVKITYFDVLTWFDYLNAFILFRLFDIIKPWPISYFDRKLKGGIGIMFDDLLAAIGAFLVLSIFTNYLN